MKTASTLLQIAALGACLAMQYHAPGEFRMPGMRRALQTMAPLTLPEGHFQFTVIGTTLAG